MRARTSQGRPADAAVARGAEALVDCIQRFHARGLCDGTGGNFSLVLEREPLQMLVTRSGSDKGRLGARDLVLVGADGRPCDLADGAPSNETPLHVAIAQATGAGAVLHTHSVWGTLVSEHFRSAGGFRIGGYEMIKGLAGVRSHEDAVFVPIVANLQDRVALATIVVGVLEAHRAARGLLVAGHGLYAWGRDLDEARRHVEVHEFLLQLAGRRLPLVRFEG
jgi:methylthioribulose-1-phosphate dehydratase